ncbi:hypothetical protein [Bdellovibrio bacteriovorus]|uniref:hypothetical protein n=1 Tax=Bdellovibrio bacteriovorus TaxID=959 RepID=UPI0035A5B9AC
MSLFNMPDLRRRAGSVNRALVEANLVRLSNSVGSFDIFLSQRQLDAEVVHVLYGDLTKMGYSVYVDWIHDRDLDRSSVNKITADRLRRRLKDSKCLLYVSTSNSSDSKWMPWELGLKDGLSGKVAILPIAASDVQSNSYQGREYLSLYPYVSKGIPRGTNNEKLWIHNDENEYVLLDNWLKGALPQRYSTSFPVPKLY